MQFLRQAVAAATPGLGICLGSQLLGEVLGGETRPATETRLGYPGIDLTAAGHQDPVIRHAAGRRFLVWHGDTFDLPPDATLLATSGGYPYAYRIGSAVAVQFHPEASPQLVDSWLDTVDESELQRMGVDPEALRREVHDKADTCRAASFALFRAWTDETADRNGGEAASRRRDR